MLMVVVLSLVAVLLIVIPMGSFHAEHNWILISIEAVACLAAAGLLLYFWIVVLELFLKLGPILLFDPVMPPPPPVNYPLMYANNMYPPPNSAPPSLPHQQQIYQYAGNY